MADVFISYSRKDAQVAQRLNQALTARGKDVWIDAEDIPPTAEWMGRIKDAIDGSNTVIFLISDHSVRSSVCSEEIAHALERQKRLVPVSLGVSDDSLVPEPLRRLNWIAAGAADAIDTLTSVLIQAIETDLQHVDMHTRLLVRAAEWDAHGRNASYLLRGSDLREAERWLGGSGGKQPAPTRLHTDYIHGSRAAETRRLRMLSYGSLVAVAISVVGAAIAFYQRGVARDQTGLARIEADTARLASDSANRARLAAEQQRDEARRQTRIAKSRELAAVALYLPQQGPKFLPRAALLAAEALKRDDSVVSDRAARRALALLPRPAGRFRPPANAGIEKLAISPDGRVGVAGMVAGSMLAFDLATGKTLATLLNKEPLGSAAFSPDGKFIAVPGRPSKLFRTSDWTEVALPAELHGDLVFSADSARLMGATQRGTVLVLGTQGLQQLGQVQCPARPRLCAFSSLGSGIVTLLAGEGREPPKIIVWNPADGTKVREKACAGAGDWLAISSDGRLALEAPYTGSGHVWNTLDLKPVLTLPALSQTASSKAVMSAAGAVLAITGADRAVHVLGVADGLERCMIAGPQGFNGIAISADGSRLATCSEDDTARIWRTEGGREIARETHSDYLDDVAFTPDGSTVLTGMRVSGDASVVIASGAADGIEQAGFRHGAINQGVVSWSGDGASVTVTHDTGSTTWELATGRVTANSTTKEPGYEEYQRTEKARKRVSTEAVERWCRAAGTTPKEAGFNVDEDSAILSPDGRYLGQSTPHFYARVLDSRAKDPQIVRAVHEANTPNVIAFSPDSTRFVSTSKDPLRSGSLLQVHELPSGRERTNIDLPFGVWSVAFSPDGTRLAVCADDGLTRIYLLRAEDLLAELHRRLRRNLTDLEWKLHLGPEPYAPTFPDLPVPLEADVLIGGFESDPSMYTAEQIKAREGPGQRR